MIVHLLGGIWGFIHSVEALRDYVVGNLVAKGVRLCGANIYEGGGDTLVQPVSDNTARRRR